MKAARRALRVFAVTLALALPIATAAVTPGAFDDEAVLIDRYLDALHALRSGDESARLTLTATAQSLALEHGRPDAIDVADYYAALSNDERRTGLALEQRFDALRDEVVLIEETGGDAPVEAGEAIARVVLDLERLLGAATDAVDVTPAARTAALLARIDVRRAERGEVEDDAAAATLSRAHARATDAVDRFTLASQRTPRLEPLWVLARIALLQDDPARAAELLDSLERLAIETDRDAWRERALLGLIGLARARGASFGACRLIERLATFRSPAECWALAREVAIQRLSEDEPERALDVLESYPPSDLDFEIEIETALDEWHALTIAAQLRAGRLAEASTALRETTVRAGTAAAEVHGLAEVTLLLDLGLAERALTLLNQQASGSGASTLEPRHSTLGQVEAQVARGRALLALGRPREALAPLELAFEAALARDRERNVVTLAAPGQRRAGGALRDASAVGEWLGLTAIETLARAHALSGAPLRAAAVIEAAHAACSVDEAQRRLLDLADRTSLGVVTWVVGANRTLAVHIRPSGDAAATLLDLGRRDIARAVQRVRDTILVTRDAPAAGLARALRMEVADTILPQTLLADLRTARRKSGDAPTLVLLPHGVLERMPFESLLIDADRRVALGIEAAVTVSLRLRDETGLAGVIDGPRAHWTAFGAPTNTGLEFLAGAQRELRSLEALQPRMEVHAGDEFDRSRLLAALAGSRPLHIATHVATVATSTAGATIAPFGLLTSGGSIVSVDEIARCGPRLPLLVLLACGSADGRAVDGLGARGIAQAALDGGTRAAVVTLWPIGDAEGRIAAVTLHAALLAGASPAEATRRVRATLARVGAPPSEWAAYRLLGRP